MKKLRVTVDGKVYDVEVEILDEGTPVVAAPAPVAAAPAPAPKAAAPAPAPVAAAPAPAPKPAAGPAGAGDVTAPLAGKVVAIDTAVGKQVKEGDQLITLEAMKMNTYIYAPKAGTVSAIHTAVGEAVDEGKVLISLS